MLNETDKGIECTLSKFADDTKLSAAVDMPEGYNITKSNQALMKFNKPKCKLLHLGWGSPDTIPGWGMND
ncbi:hypothetical protein DUI87_06013 [Hirundo rustica rustica]|uniref:Reverse transcriptase domain-containing protein n=1 Tax=Hirundo rustica rustica TaxID=333673 RepID=A0A3M0KXL0_HIRRU|nr:hypothetical protein DUI87_06013 [Hirundo rustica rustica]